ncbi:hypothetical protein EPUS_06618 [Endocarpon pusillum Z07020]|uniref:Heterokaryon incompatibility domain-containing protein n=1 Tax=Endocarpon pusillum (strain Z07020 / HMAS-L-300199) TaxID=1263415 RepID=U1HUV0_ENDPU|nr:uncharacterized protein EPUS_06618 [Endocarpon pusillum Z07020]ERF74440.1 hypothetical protein EPUS_06618 [Endocarpon pusillum Z07020]
MWNDIDWDFRDVCAQLDKPVYHRMLDIQRKGYSSGGKTLNRRCVEKRRKRRNGQYFWDDVDGAIELRYVQPRQGYIAVSCPWQLPRPNDVVTGKYRIEPDCDMKELKYPQDVVLDRVTKFADVEGMPFWIDKLCIDQLDGSDEKEIAIQSMDMIYKQSALSLGLLFVRIDSKEEVECLRDLMCGSCVTEWQNRRGNDEYSLAVSLQKARKVLEVLDLIVKDMWWERAWIFQEEYLSGVRMRLLIRSSQSTRLKSSSMGFGNIPGELEVGAVEFREEATRFCLAFRQRAGVSEGEKNKCTEILKKAGKYNILLPRNTAGMTLEAMSPTIFEEIGRRNMEYTSDILAIAPNACDYSERLNTNKLQQERESLSLSILTLYVLNGEILRHNSPPRKHFIGNIFEFLKHNTLNVELPLEEKGLTFIKHCRFPNVTLSRAGIKTKGIIWKLRKKIDPHHFSTMGRIINKCHLHPKIREKINRHHYWEHSRKCLDYYEHQALWILVDWLLYGESRSYRVLARFLMDFLENIAPDGYVEDWTWKHIMYVMAISVARAIRDGRQLRLGCVCCDDKNSPYTAIFVRDRVDRQSNECFALTSWAPAKEITQGNLLLSSCSKYTSLEIDYNGSVDGPPRAVPKRWLNGLCFFSTTDAEEVVIPWPRSIRG